MIKLYQKGSKLHSVVKNLCPKCHKGKFWPTDNPFKNIFIKNGGDLGCCKNCSFQFEIEPGFWFGAMYVSYALSVFLSLLVWLIINLFNENIGVFMSFCIIALSIVGFSPLVYFYSRLIWINLFVTYEK